MRLILKQLTMNRQVLKTRRREAGFSLIELTVVCAIILLIALMAIPQIVQIITNYRLDASGRSVAGLLQKARLQAVETNSPAYAQTDTSKQPNIAYVNADQSAYVPGNPNVPDVALGSYVSFTSTGTLPVHDQLDNYL